MAAGAVAPAPGWQGPAWSLVTSRADVRSPIPLARVGLAPWNARVDDAVGHEERTISCLLRDMARWRDFELPQRIEQRLCLFEVWRVETFAESGVDRREEFSGLDPLAVIAP